MADENVTKIGESVWVYSDEQELGFILDKNHRGQLSPYAVVWNKNHKNGPLIALSVADGEVVVQLPGSHFPSTVKFYPLDVFLNAIDHEKLETCTCKECPVHHHHHSVPEPQ